VSGIQWLTEANILEKATLRQNPVETLARTARAAAAAASPLMDSLEVHHYRFSPSLSPEVIEGDHTVNRLKGIITTEPNNVKNPA
jgi:hypothetical protein